MPIENQITIKKPPANCGTDFLRGIPGVSGNITEDKDGSCTFKSVVYQDLDDIPSGDCCSSCFCDFGIMQCTTPDCIACLNGAENVAKQDQYDDTYGKFKIQS